MIKGTFIHSSVYGSYTTECEIIAENADTYDIKFYDIAIQRSVSISIEKDRVTLKAKPLEYFVIKYADGRYRTNSKTGSSVPAIYNSKAKAKAKAYGNAKIMRWSINEEEVCE